MVAPAFKMCRYCGNRIENAYGRNGRPRPDGDYCDPSCADAVHGFDNKLIRERSGKVVSFDPRKHDRACQNTVAPDAAMMAKEDGAAPEDDASREFRALLDLARRVDRRLPDILLGMANGETQEDAAQRWGVDRSRVAQMLTQLREYKRNACNG